MTIFLPCSYDIPYKQYVDSSRFVITIPDANSTRIIENHPFCIIDYALISPNNINKLQGLKHDKYNQVLDDVKLMKFSLYQPTNHVPTRFCIVSESEFITMKIDLKLYCWDQLKKQEKI